MKQQLITIILPIHKMDENYKELLLKAVGSIENFHNDANLLIVCPSNVKDEINKMTLSQTLSINFKVHNESTDFCNQLNIGIEACKTEWFSILEIDDTYNSQWLKLFNDYSKEHPDVDVFLPIVKDVNTEDKFIGYINESVWAYGFTDVQGFLDNEALLDFQNYQTSGGIYRTNVIKEQGKFKENIKLTFSYEFLLRLTNNNVKIMTIPKIGYIHLNMREDSLFWLYKNDENLKLNEGEVKFWLDTAKKEFFFKNKRDVNYTEA
jgi:hypothetical protein